MAADIHFQQQPFAELASKRPYGCVICNPPYGERLGRLGRGPGPLPRHAGRIPPPEDLVVLHPHRPSRFRGGAGPRGRPAAEALQRPHRVYLLPVFRAKAGDQRASRNRRCPPPSREAGLRRSVGQGPGAGGNLPQPAGQAGPAPPPLAYPLGITCYRLYERDIPEVPLVVDRYEDCLHIAEFERPHEHTPAEHADWLDLMKRTAGEVLEIPAANVFLKRRERHHGPAQYRAASPRKAAPRSSPRADSASR